MVKVSMCDVKGVGYNVFHLIVLVFLPATLLFDAVSLLSSVSLPATAGGCCQRKSSDEHTVPNGRQTKIATSWRILWSIQQLKS